MHWVREGGLADSGEGKGTGLEQGAEGTWLCGRGEGTELDRGGGEKRGMYSYCLTERLIPINFFNCLTALIKSCISIFNLVLNLTA